MIIINKPPVNSAKDYYFLDNNTNLNVFYSKQVVSLIQCVLFQ